MFFNFTEALHYLTPLRSFTTRFLIMGTGNWSLLVSNMRGENCSVDAYTVSRVTGCSALGIFMQPERRELQVFENGKKLREVQSLKDGDIWYYREEGMPQDFEMFDEYSRTPKSNRLRVDALWRYFGLYTGMEVPDWKNTEFSPIIGLERSTKDLRVPIATFETICDL